MTCVLVGFNLSLLALIHSLTSGTQTVNGDPYIADWHADVNLAVVGILVDVQTMTQDQLFKLSSVQKEQQRPQYGTLRNSKQKCVLAG